VARAALVSYESVTNLEHKRGQRTVDATVSTVSAAAELGGLVNLRAIDDERVNVQALRTSKYTMNKKSESNLGLGVALSVLQQLQNELSALLRPAARSVAPSLQLDKAKFPRCAFLIYLSVTANTIAVASARNNLLLLLNVLEVGDGTAQVHSTESIHGLTGVLLGVRMTGFERVAITLKCTRR
jgi:hypothetical protein